VQASNTAHRNVSSVPLGQSRMTRLWLLALLILTAVVAGGVLFTKYQLEALRTTVQAEIAQRTGIFLEANNVRVDGLRGLRMEQLHMMVETENGPTIDIHVPDALLLVSLAELLQRRVSISRIQLDDAHIRLFRPQGHFWFTGDVTERSALTSQIPFRAVGRNCSIEIERIVGDSSFEVDAINFDLNRLADSPHLIANLDGHLDDTESSGFQVFARYSSLENFDLRVQGDELNSERLAPFFPLIAEHIASGTAQPSIRVSGYPRRTMVVGVELPFDTFTLREEPDFPIPQEGRFTALASYDMNDHQLTLNTAKTLSPEFEGQVEGTISFAQDPPLLDLKLEVQHLAMDDIMAFASGAWLEEHGTLALEAADPYRFFVTFTGDTTAPEIGVEAQLGMGSLHFEPVKNTLPKADLDFSLMSLSWRSGETLPTGRLSLSDGTIVHAKSGIEATGVSGNLQLHDGGLQFTPLVAQVAGNTLRGSLDYGLASETLTFDLSGDLAAVESLGPLAENPKLQMQGPVTLDRLQGTVTPTKYEIVAAADLTRTAIDWEWWISKKPGVGARIQELQIEVDTRKEIRINGSAALDTATIDASASLIYKDGGWQLQAVNATSPRIEMRTVDKVINVPYAISGGESSAARLDWRRITTVPDEVLLEIGGHIDTLSMVPLGTARPLVGSNITIDTQVSKKNEVRTGHLELSTTATTLPPFGSPWLLPLRAADDPSLEEFPPLDRDWTYTLSSETIQYPPWSGTDFRGKAYATPSTSGFTSFEATVDEGMVNGMYEKLRADNIHHLNAKWEDVPASYLLKHLKLPDIFTGTMSGGIEYNVDGDDSGTLQGSGYFDVADGQFSADYLVTQFERQIEEASITLPPNMKFSRFSADVTLDGDIIKTNNMILESEAVTVSGDGQFVVEGDMDYRLRLSLPPETAKGVPALRTYFNLDGLKHSQTDLELAFHIYGPTFAPRMELEGLPSVGDTIVSGAVEVTSDVMKVVDLPRQILLDLFKIGGGIVGAGGKKAPSE